MATKTWERVAFWHELMSNDPEGAQQFYREVVGLATAPLEGSPFPYTLWMQEAAPVGGLVPPQGKQSGWPSGQTPHWVVSFAVEEVDQAVKKTQALGGQVLVPPMDIPQFGRAAVLKDPEGAVFGVFQSLSG